MIQINFKQNNDKQIVIFFRQCKLNKLNIFPNQKNNKKIYKLIRIKKIISIMIKIIFLCQIIQYKNNKLQKIKYKILKEILLKFQVKLNFIKIKLILL